MASYPATLDRAIRKHGTAGAGFRALDTGVPPPKRAFSLRVDQDVLDWFRSHGPRYQSRMNAVLRAYMSRMQDT